MEQRYTSLYTAFDVFPSGKGAATHIHHFANTLLKTYSQGILYVLGDEKLPETETWDNGVDVWRFKSENPNFLERTELYSEQLLFWLRTQKNLKICHFRDIWGGVPILLNPDKQYKTIFEVNALPSIELPYRYTISDKILRRIQQLEQFCLENADIIVVPSQIIKNFLIQKGVSSSKIQIITNGAEIPEKSSRPEDAPEKYVIYFGALQNWQGVDTLLRAFRLLQDLDIKLVICSSHKPRHSKVYAKFAEKIGLQEKIIWKYQLPKQELYTWVEHAICSVAPLKECSRNLEQGCSPLKIFESMAVGTPVIASDMPVTREIINDDTLGKLIRADRPMELARAIRIWLAYPEKAKEIGANAKEHIEKLFSWEQKKVELMEVLKKLLD
ncbi:MAG: glycosyltransferase family 4 protein [Raineya sp.]|jgi:glycosyltransferase involved in cell wall biosynthesis|nr:glycosyltransferase family 4 protein [Raineya sp.]